MPKPKEEPAAEWDGIEIGDQVKHPKWGVGTVLFRSGTGAAAKAIVVFPVEGQKKLMLRYAKLKKVGGGAPIKGIERPKAEPAAPRPKPATALFGEDEEVALPLDKGLEEEELLLGDEAEEVAGFDEEEESEFEPDEPDEDR